MATNILGGINQDTESTSLGNLTFPDPAANHTWFNDFDDYDANQWVITEVGSGTRAVGNADGGVLVITNAASDDDHNYLQWSGVTGSTTAETFLWEAAKSMWFKTRLKVSDATQSDLVIGLQITDTSPLDVTDGLFFIKADGSTSLTFRAEKNDTASTVTTGTVVSDTYFTCGFWWNAEDGTLRVYFNGNRVGNLTTTSNFPDDEELTLSIAIQNGDGNARSMSLDYLFVSKQRD